MIVTPVYVAIILQSRILYPEGFGMKRPTIKLEAVPTVFCFSQPAKFRKFSKTREAKALHYSNIDNLLAGSNAAPQSCTGNSNQPRETLEYSVASIWTIINSIA